MLFVVFDFFELLDFELFFDEAVEDLEEVFEETEDFDEPKAPDEEEETEGYAKPSLTAFFSMLRIRLSVSG